MFVCMCVYVCMYILVYMLRSDLVENQNDLFLQISHHIVI